MSQPSFLLRAPRACRLCRLAYVMNDFSSIRCVTSQPLHVPAQSRHRFTFTPPVAARCRVETSGENESVPSWLKTGVVASSMTMENQLPTPEALFKDVLLQIFTRFHPILDHSCAHRASACLGTCSVRYESPHRELKNVEVDGMAP